MVLYKLCLVWMVPGWGGGHQPPPVNGTLGTSWW